jgi:hypothetical protein
MTSLPVSRPRTQSEPHACTCTSQTVKAGVVVAVTNSVHWLRRPQVAECGWRHALLGLDGAVYHARCEFAGGESGVVFQVVDLKRLDTGTEYRLTIGHGDDQCSCPHKQYRGCECKHLAGVKAALAYLEEQERLEWEAEVALAALDTDTSPAPF